MATCSGSTFKPIGNCDGVGACAQPSMICGAYACGATSCNTMCNGNMDCTSGYTCMSSVCTNLKAKGQSCVAGAECFTGFCTEGICCEAASCGTCGTCGPLGICHPVAPGGPDPLGTCMNMAVSTCGTTGVCDGTGQCATYAAGTTCLPSTCATSLLTVSTCSGGVCMSQTMNCAPFACDGSNACKTSCVDDGDCATPNVCTAPSCGP
jgi:hypothetical protein